MDKKALSTIKAKAQTVLDSMEADTSVPGNPTGIVLLAEALVALIETLEKS